MSSDGSNRLLELVAESPAPEAEGLGELVSSGAYGVSDPLSPGASGRSDNTAESERDLASLSVTTSRSVCPSLSMG